MVHIQTQTIPIFFTQTTKSVLLNLFTCSSLFCEKCIKSLLLPSSSVATDHSENWKCSRSLHSKFCWKV